MSKIHLEQSTKNINFRLEQRKKNITSHAGMALIGKAIKRYTALTQIVDTALPKRCGTPSSDLAKIYVGLLAQGKNDFEAVNGVRGDKFFGRAMDLSKPVPTEASLRTRFDAEAEVLIPLIDRINTDFIINRQAPITPLHTGHTALDIDVTPHDNSRSKKEGVSRTYKDRDGYAPIASYLGAEGWLLSDELRPGSQHSQNGFIDTMDRNLAALHRIFENRPLSSRAILTRLDGGHDAKETRAWFHQTATPLRLDFILKWNPRKDAGDERKAEWFEYAKGLGHLAHWETPRPGKRVVTFSVFVEESHGGKSFETRRIMRITERSTDIKTEQALLTPMLEIEGWWTTLDLSDEAVIALYRDHATSEQFHSEIKTDLDLERLPSGKFNTNDLILALAALTYNILRWIGLEGLLQEDSPVRHTAKRRRIRTVIQEMITLGAQYYERGRQHFLRFGQNTTAFFAFQRVYNKLSYG